MTKRILSGLLCIILLLSSISIFAHAEEITYYQILIDAGDGVQTEKAIIEEDEIYIAAQNFSKYTRFEFTESSHTFLIKGQEADKAFKKVIVNPEKKKATVGTKIIELENCFIVDGIIYLPFCQMLPILNADIIEIDSGVIHIVNNELSMAELLYDFDINDYWFDINEEFFGKSGLLIGLVAPGYIFDTVVKGRFNRLDIVFQSGACEDYQTILTNYLKDDELFKKAMTEKDSTGELLKSITGLTGISEKFYDVYDWFEKIEDIDYEPLKSDKLVKFIQKTSGDGALSDDLELMVSAVHDDILLDKVSAADILEGIDFLYNYLNRVNDHWKMLDAVYGIQEHQSKLESIAGTSKSFTSVDPEYLAAEKIYELYSGNIIPAFTEKVTTEVFKELMKDFAAVKTLGIYSLTANLAGEILELYLPGDSGKLALLPQHNTIATSSMVKATVPTLDTEKSTENYRLSILLTLLASRACYDIMDEISSGYGQENAYYQQKIDKIEKLITGLYLVAKNVAFDTYENYTKFAEQNKNMIKDSDLFDNSTLYPDVDEAEYLNFLNSLYEYNYYALLDINGDGVLEMLATDEVNSKFAPVNLVDLFVYKNEEILLGYNDIGAKFEVLLHDSDNHWIAQYHGGNSGGGMSFYYIDEELCVQETSFDYRCDEVDGQGNEIWRKYHNGVEIHDGNIDDYNLLLSKWENSNPKDIVFKAIPKTQPNEDSQQNQVQPTPSFEARVNEIRELYHAIQNNLSEYTVEDGGSDTTRYLDKNGMIKKITASATSYTDLDFEGNYTAEYYYDNNTVFFIHLFNQIEDHFLYLDRNNYLVCVQYIDEKGIVHNYPEGKEVNELSIIGQYCTFAMHELHWAGIF